MGAVAVDVPEVDVGAGHVAHDAQRAGPDVAGPPEELIGHAVRAAEQAEAKAAHGEVPAGTVDGPVPRVQRAPDEIGTVAHGGDPGRPPHVAVGPHPAVVVVMAPAAVVARDVAERVVADPDVAAARHVAPVPGAVGHVFGDDRGPPVMRRVHVDPLAVGLEIGHPDGRRLVDGRGRQRFRANGQHPGAFPVPRVEGVLFPPVKRHGVGRKVAGVHVGALARHDHHVPAAVGANDGTAPAHGDRGGPVG